MSLVTIEAIVKVHCDKCGEGLKAKSNGDVIYIEPCDHCLENEYGDGYNDGFKDGEGE